jgi:hypothetical protein
MAGQETTMLAIKAPTLSVAFLVDGDGYSTPVHVVVDQDDNEQRLRARP